MNTTNKTRQVQLAKFKYALRAYLSEEFLDSFYNGATLNLQWIPWAGLIELHLYTGIAGEDLAKFELPYPRDWWHAFKERWFPCWLRHMFPVEYTIYYIDVQALYPKISLPGEEHIIKVLDDCGHPLKEIH